MYVDTPQGLKALCQKLAQKSLIAFDTEFVAEDSYKPELCLVQVAAEGIAAVIDPYTCGEITPFWELLLDPNRTVVVHSGREEILFCLRSTGKTIPGLFDIQIAAALIGCDYPASYANLVQRFTGKQLDKEETRSDWRQRPLTPLQLQYALQDVRDLPLIHAKLSESLNKRGRMSWLEEEVARKQSNLMETESQEQWHRLSGIQTLTGKSVAIARRIWLWREQQAEYRGLPSRRILRDDLLIELAKRGSTDVKRMATLRGMNHRHLRDLLPDIACCIEQGQKDVVPSWPKRQKFSNTSLSGMLIQYLMAGLALICKTRQLAPSIVGTSDDLRDFAAYRLSSNPEADVLPALLSGWRGEIVGNHLDGLISGKECLVVADPYGDWPLQIRPLNLDHTASD